MNMLMTHGIQLHTQMSIERIGDDLIHLNRTRPVILWDIEPNMLVFFSDLHLPLIPELQLGFDISYQKIQVLKTSGRLIWKESCMSVKAYQYGVLLDTECKERLNNARYVNRMAWGERVRIQTYDFLGSLISEYPPGQHYDVST
ncbi:hypothetical protein [Paenibacillus pini]|uniref:Uncharacterized protein n=1 Tax=Paenibacillus pini JCM 16418 TaxID=1236976 RepID=W7YHY5_9BACL|nr:hypothetical protein [Paenibacillus pini]GAF08062.1 hypothetical protein JCM16418_2100 [Paenibacillus pini JCM 16418]